MRRPLRLAPLLVVAALAGCEMPTPLARGPDVLVRSGEPLYQFRTNGEITPTSCNSRQPSGYGGAPSGCIVDSALAAQVADPRDMVAPRQPGPPYAAPAAAAATGYLYGNGAALPRLEVGGEAGGGGAARVDIPPGDPAPETEEETP